MDTTDEETLTEEWTLDQPISHTRTTAIVEVKGTVDVVLSPLVAEALDRYDCNHFKNDGLLLLVGETSRGFLLFLFFSFFIILNYSTSYPSPFFVTALD